MMELLSPAGSREALIAAVQNGADAVYFGGSILNARRFADNFSGDGLIWAFDYCHERGVKAYVTLNTLVFDREMDKALDFAKLIHTYGADAVLVQDIGLAAVIRENCPDLHIHASTQMGIHDIGGLNYLKSIGVTRAVLAREVALDDIARLHKNCDIELETFAHGALCMSFSGSCLYSSMAGERSGNRGTCAQPCRKCASVKGMPKETDRCLSPNDICMIEHLDQLEKAGVCCVKIEGRMKKPEYVATVTRCYRAALDGASKEETAKMKRELFAFFNRGEFSTAHFFSDSVKTDRVASSKPERENVSAAAKSMLGENKKRPVSMELSLCVGEKAKLTIALDGIEKTVFGEVVSKAMREQTEQNYAERLKKLGDTPFELVSCSVKMDKECYLSAAALNALRRDAVGALCQSFHIRNKTNESALLFKHIEPKLMNAAKITYCVVQTETQANNALEEGADMIGVEPCALDLESLKKLKANMGADKKLILTLPNVIITSKQRQYVASLIASGVFDGAEANNIGQTELIQKLPIKIAGKGLNAINTYSMSELLGLGYDLIVPSAELTKAQLSSLCDRYGSVMLTDLHEKTMLMQLVHCPVKEHLGCKNCTLHAGSVTDEAGRVFPLETVRYPDKCLVRLMNCNTTDLIDLYRKLPETAGSRLSFIGEDEESVTNRLSALKSAAAGESVAQLENSTRGHYNRKVD